MRQAKRARVTSDEAMLVCTRCEQLLDQNADLRAEVAELKAKSGVKLAKSRRVREKPVMHAPTDAMKLQDPAAAEEITNLIANIKYDEHHLAKLLGMIAKLKEQE